MLSILSVYVKKWYLFLLPSINKLYKFAFIIIKVTLFSLVSRHLRKKVGNGGLAKAQGQSPELQP